MSYSTTNSSGDYICDPSRATSAVAYHRALYSELATGASLTESVQRGRLALHENDDGVRQDYRALDWATPTLYLRAPDMGLIQTEGEPAAAEAPEGAVPTAPASDHATLKDAIGTARAPDHSQSTQCRRPGLLHLGP